MPRTIEMVDSAMVEGLRQKTEAERFRTACGMWRSARQMLLNLLRAEHPDWSDQQIQDEVARRLAHGAG